MEKILTVGELKEILNDLNDDTEVFFKDDEHDWIKEAKEVKIIKDLCGFPLIEMLVIVGFEKD